VIEVWLLTEGEHEMKRSSRFLGFLVGALALVAGGAALAAEEADVSGFYEIHTEGSSQKVKVGAKGTLVLAIQTKAGAHISDEAPLKVELTGDKLKPEKSKLTHADSVGKREGARTVADPRFEVPFTAEATGKGSLDAKLTFFVCTDKVCSRQQKTLSVPVQVD
jgi:hypothetical protein